MKVVYNLVSSNGVKTAVLAIDQSTGEPVHAQVLPDIRVFGTLQVIKDDMIVEVHSKDTYKGTNQSVIDFLNRDSNDPLFGYYYADDMLNTMSGADHVKRFLFAKYGDKKLVDEDLDIMRIMMVVLWQHMVEAVRKGFDVSDILAGIETNLNSFDDSQLSRAGGPACVNITHETINITGNDDSAVRVQKLVWYKTPDGWGHSAIKPGPMNLESLKVEVCMMESSLSVSVILPEDVEEYYIFEVVESNDNPRINSVFCKEHVTLI